MSARRHFSRGIPPCFCVSRGNKGVASEARVYRGNKRVRSGATWSVQMRGVEAKKCPRNHKTFSQIIANLSTVLCSTGTILRRKGYGRESKAQRVKENTSSSPPSFADLPRWSRTALFRDTDYAKAFQLKETLGTRRGISASVMRLCHFLFEEFVV